MPGGWLLAIARVVFDEVVQTMTDLHPAGNSVNRVSVERGRLYP